MRISDWSSDVCSSDLAVIALDDPRPAALQPPARRPVARQHPVLIIDDPQFDAERRTALAADDVDLLVEAQRIPVPWPLAHRSDRAGLGHPPRMADIDACLRSEERRGGNGCVRTCKYRW